MAAAVGVHVVYDAGACWFVYDEVVLRVEVLDGWRGLSHPWRYVVLTPGVGGGRLGEGCSAPDFLEAPLDGPPSRARPRIRHRKSSGLLRIGPEHQ